MRPTSIHLCMISVSLVTLAKFVKQVALDNMCMHSLLVDEKDSSGGGNLYIVRICTLQKITDFLQVFFCYKYHCFCSCWWVSFG